MEHIEFISILVAASIVIFWYIQNEASGGLGGAGILALRSASRDENAESPKSYRPIDRTALRGRTTLSPSEAVRPREKSYRILSENDRLQHKFRRQDEVRYRVKDKAAPHKE
ncbi:MAG: hypothetical protein HKN14_12115 [Marinicaulis sp.]|nr:hypothetical protein [Marinicaulis sp.]